MQKWEYTYLQVYVDQLRDHWKDVREYGDNGWELISVGAIEYGFLLFFKRPKKG